MRTIIIGSLFLLTASWAFAEIPRRIDDPEGGTPIWLIADEARNEDGSLRWELLPRGMWDDLRRDIEQGRRMRAQRGEDLTKPSSTCQTFTISAGGAALDPSGTFDVFVPDSEVIVTGRVRDIADGFYRGQIMALLEVELEKPLKLPRHVRSATKLLILFAQAEIAAEGEMLCFRSMHYPHRPAVGARLLVFGERIVEPDARIVSPNSSRVFFEREDGTLSFGWDPDRFVNAAPGWEVVEAWIEGYVNNAEAATANRWAWRSVDRRHPRR